MQFWRELRRRNVFKVAAVYAIVAWLLAQVASIAFPVLLLPDWILRAFVVLLILGFPLVLVFAWAFEITPEGIKHTRQVPPEASTTHITSERLNYVVTSLLGVAVLFLVVDNYVLDDRARAPSDSLPPARTLPNSIAVLPFQNLSLDPENAFFAVGIHEEVLNQIVKLRNLSVISRTSVLRFEGSNLPIPEIAAQLNVRTVLEGSVRYAGERVRIAAQLIDAETDEHLWSEVYERDMSDIFAIQADIAMNIASALAAELSPEGRAQLEARPTESIEAYELYLSALAARRPLSQANVERSMQQIDRALEIDPDFALAWVGKSELLLAMSLFLPAEASVAAGVEAQRAAQRAIDLAPELPAAQVALARAGTARGGSWSATAAQWQHALELIGVDLSQNADFALYYGQYLFATGRVAEAGPHLMLARTLDPLNDSTAAFLGAWHGTTGDYAASRAEFRRASALFGTSWLGLTAAIFIDLGEDRFESFRSAWEGDFSTPYAELEPEPVADLEDRESLIGAFRDTIESANAWPAVQMAGAGFAALGDPESAVVAMDRFIEATPSAVWTAWFPVFRDARALPSFKELMVRRGLAASWREYGWPDFCRPLDDEDFECF